MDSQPAIEVIMLEREECCALIRMVRFLFVKVKLL